MWLWGWTWVLSNSSKHSITEPCLQFLLWLLMRRFRETLITSIYRCRSLHVNWHMPPRSQSSALWYQMEDSHQEIRSHASYISHLGQRLSAKKYIITHSFPHTPRMKKRELFLALFLVFGMSLTELLTMTVKHQPSTANALSAGILRHQGRIQAGFLFV